MDDESHNIFDVLDSPSTNEITQTTSKPVEVSSLRRSHIPLMNASNGSYSSTQKPSSKRKRRQTGRADRALQGLGFVNPGPKNLVNVANVPARRLKTRQPTAQDKPNSIKPLYDNSGLLLCDQTDRCDCNRLTCSGCFIPCTSCQSSKCGLECRNLRTYAYEYRLYGIPLSRTQQKMLARKTSSSKKKGTSRMANGVPLDSSLTSMDWLPKMQIGEKSPSVSSSTTTTATSSKQASPDSTSLPITPSKVTHVQYKLEANEVELPTSTVHVKPPYSYVTLIRQAILSSDMQRMTLNEIYQWILEVYPYFRTAPAKWKNSIRHNLSLNKCFKRLQRSSDDPGKGSYWALDESDGSHSQANSRRRRFDPIQPSHHFLPSSPHTHSSQSTGFYSNQNSMIYGDINSTSRQSSSTDESDTTMSSAVNTTLISWDDFNTDLSASFRRFRQQVLEVPASSWVPPTDTSSTNSPTTNPWNYDMLPPHESNTLFDSVKLASSGEINWSDVDVKPYCDDFRTNSTLQHQDRDKLLNLASSISSFFDYTGITNLAQNKISNESVRMDRLPIASNRSTLETTHNFSSLPIVIEEEAFDWDSIT